ncbi:alpha/beta fold hydrolase [Aspergillus candidus]|uniref:Alpha/beta-hydrolase n=1 Tax=Aspergillus candidus TaxID=41067 RepID=A0A2I2FI34_ASPCN|nr:alpha/beta-hydrolase [Aspergillus candidus]PLB40295.1 alpha/beta-hydrolase [Aspergillus candidus]
MLSFTSHNPSSPQTILFIHSGFSTSTEWDQVLHHLTCEPHPYHVLVPDLPSHGTSLHLKPLSVYSTAYLLSQLIRDHAHGGTAHVVGASLGAHIAAQLAAHYPARVSSLLVTGFNIFAPIVLTPLLPPLVYFFLHTAELLSHPTEGMARLQRGEGSLDLCRDAVEMVVSARELEVIDGDHVSTLIVVAAAKEGLILPAWDRQNDARRLLESVRRTGNGPAPASRAVLHRGVRHSWQIDEPELFARTVRAWVAGLELPAGFEDLD